MSQSIMLALRKLNSAMRKRIDALQVKQEIDHLTGMNSWIIGYLSDHEQEDIYQRDLERELGMCRSGVSKMMAVLEQKGLLTRNKVSSDDRLKKIVLTERGRQYTEQIRADNSRVEQQLTEGFSEDELRLLASFLDRMRANILIES